MHNLNKNLKTVKSNLSLKNIVELERNVRPLIKLHGLGSGRYKLINSGVSPAADIKIFTKKEIDQTFILSNESSHIDENNGHFFFNTPITGKTDLIILYRNPLSNVIYINGSQCYSGGLTTSFGEETLKSETIKSYYDILRSVLDTDQLSGKIINYNDIEKMILNLK